MPALYAATAGYDVIEEVGVAADPRAFALPHAAPHRPAATRPASRSSRPATPNGAAARSRLDPEPRSRPQGARRARRNLRLQTRPDGGIRIGAHFFNSEDEVRHTVSELAEIVASGSYEKYEGAAARF